MQRKFFMTLLLIYALSSSCYAAASDDIYVRQDVFDAKMEAQFNRLHAEIGELKGDIKALSSRIDGNFLALSSRINGLEKRVEDSNTFLYYLLVLLGAMLLLPFVNRWLDSKANKKEEAARKFITLDDVRKLIEENNAQIFSKLGVNYK
ncbi:MAG: hypothetical protein IJS40_08205 [Synergistaceae bacterium]|nr:hypothetical protein [Synergistaceae bacterium]